MSMLASLFMVGCSQEEITPNGEDSGNGEVSTSYMAVNLISSVLQVNVLPWVTRMALPLRTRLPVFVSIFLPQTEAC